MLKSFKPYLLVVILSLVFTSVSVNHAFCQPPPPPPGGSPGTGHNLNANQGAGAPLGEGIWILITLAFSYGLNRHIRNREQKVELAAPRNTGSSATEDDFSQPGTKYPGNIRSAIAVFFNKRVLLQRKNL